MLVRRDLGFPSLVFLVVVVVVPVIVLIIRRKLRHSVARSEEIKRLVVSASEELARAEFEARESYYYTANATPSARVSVLTPASVPTYVSIPLGSPLKPQYQCAVCFCPTTTRCAKCKAVRYCSGKCQIIHWRQGHKHECRPYVAVSPINDEGGSSYRQVDHEDQSDTFDTEAQQTFTSSVTGRFPENSDNKDDESSLAHQQGSTKISAGITVENLVKSLHQTLGSPARKSTGLGKNNLKRSNPSDEDAQSSSSCWTNNASSFSEPSTTSSGFWDTTVDNKKSSINDHDDFASAGSYTANQNSNIANGCIADKVIIDGLGNNKFNDCSDSSKDDTSKFRESKNSPSHRASVLKDDSLYDISSNKSRISHTSKSREISSSPKAPNTSSRHPSHATKPVKVDDDTVSSPKLTETCRIRSGSKTSKSKAVDQVKPSKSLEGVSDRYAFKGLFPYEMFVKLYASKKIELQPCGLKNCGNSCYANAVLQCLIYTPPLTAYFLEGLHSKACDKRGWCFTCEVEGLVMKAKDGNSPLSPIRILTHIENIGSNLGHGKEEDAHEFLRYVIDALQAVCIKEAAGANALNSLEEETSLIGLTFGGYLRSKIICIKCGGKSEMHERMMDLTVEIEGDIGTLEEALDKFTCCEILDGENKYKCSRCKSYEKARKKLTLLEAPNVLTIALKRFQCGKFGKLNKSVEFPEILDMAPYVSGTSDKSPVYRLYGVVVHVDTMNDAFSGHYVCYVKNHHNRWFKFNDTMVNEVDLQHVLTKGAYMLFYARCSPRAPRSIRSSIIQHQDPRKQKTFVHSTEPWEACNYQPASQPGHRQRSLEEESSSSSDNSGFFSESCSCSTDSSTQRDSSDHIPGDWEHDYWNNSSTNINTNTNTNTNMNVTSSDSDTSSTSSFPSPLYSRLSHLYTSRTNEDECRKLDCSCNSCSRVRVTNLNLDRLGSKPSASVTFRRSATRGMLD
ncbi:unnamed protein product [Lactuca saligna]|uniref:ubiquitinyl hydrolase 1 n=1 Tax=Lactuca saligna TaxID=75948 RepID=A0AA35VCL1_LACSI|nr:unnamed protein product [Lactuca saligna]